ncbi:A/G-specific adenine glycosylase [Phycicoccus sp. M110.8]|uniref:A/G-specific adenine glycosylase n=1 Tax=Phycicoccus sp. M110.8 TaxID=3075433 RepID=UPI0028FDB123|nr:A/G-specific adenine glycosylase [Phycicoccus sp. M110.8]MDU0314231.1 A/G-specific adenine glycosylase [Phycicoccus sp. M110.8]
MSRPSAAELLHAPELLHARVLPWYASAARDLPWRRDDATPWGIFVSEVMLQQTPVVRVLPVWQQWLQRWPTPADLAAVAPGEAVREWGRLGYPRRALRLHAAAAAMMSRFDGAVPGTEAELLTLPGVGTYTAAAVATFAFGERTTVVDTNVRRVLARAVEGVEYPAASPTRAELTRAEALVPVAPGEARTWSVAVMELGALVCTARTARCDQCPLVDVCAWRLAGHPPHAGPARRGQSWHGTDRQLRGRLLAALRHSTEPVHRSALEALSDDVVQRERCLDSLVADGLVEPLDDDLFALPGGSAST